MSFGEKTGKNPPPPYTLPPPKHTHTRLTPRIWASTIVYHIQHKVLIVSHLLFTYEVRDYLNVTTWA